MSPVLKNVSSLSGKLFLQPSWTSGLLCCLLPEPNKDIQVQGASMDDGRFPQVNDDGDHDDDH